MNANGNLMMNAFDRIIDEIQGMRTELDELEVKLERNDILRRNIPIHDDYAHVQSLDWMDAGGHKP